MTGEDVADKKRAQDVYLKVLVLLDLSACECLAIEDSRNGLSSGLSVGEALISGMRLSAAPLRWLMISRSWSGGNFRSDLECHGIIVWRKLINAVILACCRGLFWKTTQMDSSAGRSWGSNSISVPSLRCFWM